MEEEREAPSAGNRTRTLACPYVYAKLSASFVGAAPGATPRVLRALVPVAAVAAANAAARGCCAGA